MGLEKYIETVPATKELTAKQREAIDNAARDVEVLERYNSDSAGRALDFLLKLTTDARRDNYEITDVTRGLSNAPRTTTASVRALADEIGFVVMPYAYLDTSNFGPPNNRFVRWLHERYGTQMYVVAPVNGYNLQLQLDGKDLPMHVPSDVAQAFLALQMSIPVLRSMQRQLKALERDVRGIWEQQNAMREEIRALHARVDEMGRIMARERAQRAQFEESVLSEWYRRGGDPLVIVLPDRGTIADDTWALVGPSWGKLPEKLEDALKKPRASQDKRPPR
jgi:hypothetical protein